MSVRPDNRENLMSLADQLIWAMQQYGSISDYETQTGIIAEPTTASRGNGHIVTVYNSTEGRTFEWKRVNADTEWMGVELI